MTVAVAIAALVLAGCAPLACQPLTVTVAAKEQRTRVESEFRGVTTDHLGRVVERRQDVPVREHWVRDTDGRWHRVSETAWRDVTVGESLGGPPLFFLSLLWRASVSTHDFYRRVSTGPFEQDLRTMIATAEPGQQGRCRDERHRAISVEVEAWRLATRSS